eukprot:1209466-Pleurochrysis_carterae.AAC.1
MLLQRPGVYQGVYSTNVKIVRTASSQIFLRVLELFMSEPTGNGIDEAKWVQLAPCWAFQEEALNFSLLASPLTARVSWPT